MFVQQLGFIELAIIQLSTYNRSVCNSSTTAWRWYSYQELSSFKVNAKYSTKKFKGVKKVFIISPHSPQEKDNNGEDWPKTIGKGRRLRSHNSGLVFCSKHRLNSMAYKIFFSQCKPCTCIFYVGLFSFSSEKTNKIQHKSLFSTKFLTNRPEHCRTIAISELCPPFSRN